MAKARISDDIRDKVKEYVEDSNEYGTISGFTEDAIRRLFEQKNVDNLSRSEEFEMSREHREEIREIVIEELRDALTS